jgi:5-oxoprolinase (ATP-hydrolysing)
MSPKFNLWVDVGGTFTDAILGSPASLGNGSRYRTTKVLSSGLTRCSVTSLDSPRRLIVRNLPACCPNFWVSSVVSIELPGGSQPKSGNVVASGADWLELDSSLQQPWEGKSPSLARPWSIELNAGLESPVLAAHLLLDIPLWQSLPEGDIRLGTTRGTNALLTRSGAAVGLCITRGFGDIPYIGNQDRPDLFALTVRKPSPLCQAILEIEERLAADGSVIHPLESNSLPAAFAHWRSIGIRSVAIVLLHSYLNPIHEQLVAEIAREFSFDEVLCSSAIIPVRKLLSRCDTTLVDAYLSPIVGDYLRKVNQQFGQLNKTPLQIMTSAGSLVSAQEFRGKDSVLSGPAGGIVAVQDILRRLDINAALAFDMGGTSTDVSRCTRDSLPLQYDTWKAGVRIVTPILSIHTVAAGGGSICSFDGVQLHVGPSSAGAFPGPACYGQGGPLTITDINLLLGIIPDDAFPFPVDRLAAVAKLQEISHQIRSRQNTTLSDLDIAAGFRRLANQAMADAIGVISTRQGADPRDHALIGFGGAAGQHQCDLADILGIHKIIDPPLAGLLSASGIGQAQHRRFATVPVYQSLKDVSWKELHSAIATQQQYLSTELEAIGYSNTQLSTNVNLELRYSGTDATLQIDHDRSLDLEAAFHQAHHRLFGYSQPQRTIELCALWIEVVGPSNHIDSMATAAVTRTEQTRQSQSVWIEGHWVDCPRCTRSDLRANETLQGPCIVLGTGHTTWIAKGWQARVDTENHLVIERVSSQPQLTPPPADDATIKQLINDPIFRDLMAQRLATIAMSMGEMLEKTAISVNIKERRDFSCAIFNDSGYLIANAPHVPVHLGAMGQTVRQLLALYPDVTATDCLVTNDPNRGGSHLPDITVVTPVHDPKTAKRIFFVACRAHHAEVGGISAGSMPPRAKCLEEEGVLLPPQYLLYRGVPQFDVIASQLKNAGYPSRSPEENIADLKAQQAANQFGANELIELLKRYGSSALHQAMLQIMDASAERVQLWLKSLTDDELAFADQLDDGASIQVTIRKEDCSGMEPSSENVNSPTANRVILRVSFKGSAPPHAGNFNANPAIVTAALLYVIRVLAGDNLPLNEGALRDIVLEIPVSILQPIDGEQARLLAASQLPAVAAGNVETSQRIVDVLLGAFQAAAASQGTMNNFLFGDGTFGYYETICGGTGATVQGPGCDAVHSHMTNTRITDPEVMEVRYPVRLWEFSIRHGSGGAGEHAGGNGVVREVEFLRPLQGSLITSRRVGRPPYGLRGGQPGSLGANLLIHRDGSHEILGSTVQLDLHQGDRLRIETPGGGGFGYELENEQGING